MKTGRRIADPAAKQLAGTYRKDRHSNIVALATPPRDVPIAPAYLTPAAKAVWDEELPRVIGCGAVEADSSLFARYCALEAILRTMIAAGEVPKAATFTALRQYGELLGIAGQRSRLARVGGAETATASPFKQRPS